MSHTIVFKAGYGGRVTMTIEDKDKPNILTATDENQWTRKYRVLKDGSISVMGRVPHSIIRNSKEWSPEYAESWYEAYRELLLTMKIDTEVEDLLNEV